MKSNRYQDIAELRRAAERARRAEGKARRPGTSLAQEREYYQLIAGATNRAHYCPERGVIARRINELRKRETWLDAERVDLLSRRVHQSVVLLNEAWRGDTSGPYEARALRDTCEQAWRLWRRVHDRAQAGGWA